MKNIFCGQVQEGVEGTVEVLSMKETGNPG
jgi:hypothetical protein